MSKERLIQVGFGSSIEYYLIEGDEVTARCILTEYGAPESPVELRLRRERVARDIASRLGHTSPFLAPSPEISPPPKKELRIANL